MKTLTLFLLIAFSFESLSGQENGKSTLVLNPPNPNDSVAMTIAVKNFKTKLLPSMIIPAVLIGYGISCKGDAGFYSSYRAKDDVQRLFGRARAPIDDYLVFAPYAEFATLLLLKQKCKNDIINTGLLIAKSEIIMLAIVMPMKYLVKEVRPDGSDNLSFPSQHTAEAFLAATIVYREYRHKSVWYGIGAYAIATTVGAYRMINNKHWESDVFVGAGIGMLATNLVYTTHLHRWGRKEICVTPIISSNNKGMAMTIKF